MTDMTLPFAPVEAGQASYLDEGHTLLSWLTTTITSGSPFSMRFPSRLPSLSPAWRSHSSASNF